MKTIRHIINNKKTSGTSTQTQAVYNPATGVQTAELVLGTTNDINTAVENSKQAFKSWSTTPPAKRAKVMFNMRQLLIDNADLVAETISKEHGKTHDDALGEVTRALEVVEYACGIPDKLKGDFSQDVGPKIDTHSIRQALGVVAGITPFNFPSMVPLWMIPMAIACGDSLWR